MVTALMNRWLAFAVVLAAMIASGCGETETEQKFSDYRGGGKGAEPWGGKTKEQFLKDLKTSQQADAKATAVSKKTADERKKIDAEARAEAKRLADEQKRAAAASAPRLRQRHALRRPTRPPPPARLRCRRSPRPSPTGK